jgi:beta-1,4-N-acetylglucosaminyltransferase
MFPFDRLIRDMDNLVAQEKRKGPIEAQIGDGQYEPRHMPYVRFMDTPAFEARFQKADMVVSHAGAGTIALALRFDKPLLVMPRQGGLAEHVNDHQYATAKRFAELKHVLVAHSADELAMQLPHLGKFRPLPRRVGSRELADRIGRFLREQSP